MKIGFIGAVPPTSVFPLDCIRSHYRKPAHPAPWIGGLLPELVKKSDFEVRVFVAHRALLKRCVVEHDGVTYEGIPCPFLERFAPHTLHFAKSMAMSSGIRKFKPDLIHAFGMENGSATMALRHGVPVSCFIQGIAEKLLPFYGQRSWVNKHVAVRCERSAVSRIPWMIAETEFAKEWALMRNARAEVVVIPHPLRPSFLEISSQPTSKRIVTVGGLDDRKGMDTIIRAFALIDDLSSQLSICGSGPSVEDLKNLAVDLGVSERIDFRGSLNTEEVMKELSRSAIFAIGSRMDTSPNVVTEAHAAGLPVVGTRAGGIPEMIEDGVDGFHVNIDDNEGMAAKLQQLLSDSDITKTMGDAGKKKVDQLNDPQRVTKEQVKFFENIRLDLEVQ
ncbi:MAG: glycosyltransferase family 4 protein [Akkermansiaceae bacterium]